MQTFRPSIPNGWGTTQASPAQSGVRRGGRGSWGQWAFQLCQPHTPRTAHMTCKEQPSFLPRAARPEARGPWSLFSDPQFSPPFPLPPSVQDPTHSWWAWPRLLLFLGIDGEGGRQPSVVGSSSPLSRPSFYCFVDPLVPWSLRLIGSNFAAGSLASQPLKHLGLS